MSKNQFELLDYQEQVILLRDAADQYGDGTNLANVHKATEIYRTILDTIDKPKPDDESFKNIFAKTVAKWCKTYTGKALEGGDFENSNEFEQNLSELVLSQISGSPLYFDDFMGWLKIFIQSQDFLNFLNNFDFKTENEITKIQKHIAQGFEYFGNRFITDGCVSDWRRANYGNIFFNIITQANVDKDKEKVALLHINELAQNRVTGEKSTNVLTFSYFQKLLLSLHGNNDVQEELYTKFEEHAKFFQTLSVSNDKLRKSKEEHTNLLEQQKQNLSQPPGRAFQIFGSIFGTIIFAVIGAIVGLFLAGPFGLAAGLLLGVSFGAGAGYISGSKIDLKLERNFNNRNARIVEQAKQRVAVCEKTTHQLEADIRENLPSQKTTTSSLLEQLSNDQDTLTKESEVSSVNSKDRLESEDETEITPLYEQGKHVTHSQLI